MHRSSESVAAIATALAKAQTELSNPEKAMVGTVYNNRSDSPQSFRYASLSSGLDIIRKTLGGYQIAVAQTTDIDRVTGTVNLTTLLLHTSGEWISSHWPVCQLSETSAPRRMGAALTYARRYALFTMVGIAGEDDLDAPDLLTEPSPAVGAVSSDSGQTIPNPTNGTVYRPRHPKPVLASAQSAALRDQLLGEMADLKDGEALALWTHRRLPSKNALTADDARIIDAAGQRILEICRDPEIDQAGKPPAPATPKTADVVTVSEVDQTQPATATAYRVLSKPSRKRNKAHLVFVASQPLPTNAVRRAPSQICSTTSSRKKSQRRIHCAAMP